MFNDGNGYSLSDVAAVTRGGSGFGGFGDGFASIIWIIVILAVLGMFGGNGFFGFGNGGNLGQALTRGELCQDMNFQDVKTGVMNIQSNLANGFALQNTNFVSGIDSVTNQLNQRFADLNTALVKSDYDIQQVAQNNFVAQLQSSNAIQNAIQQCCCGMQASFANLAAQNAADTCALQTSIANAARDITDNTNAQVRGLYDFLVNDKISDLQQQNQELRLAASQERQNNYLIGELRPCAKPAYITCNPYTSSYGVGLNNCGCGM